MKQKIDICEQTLISKILKKYIKIVLFALLYTTVTVTMQSIYDCYSHIGIALIVLGILGAIYTLFVLFHEKIWRLFYKKVDIDFVKSCIVKTRSMNYFEVIYIPYIEYTYTYRNNKYKSSNACWDFESCYDTQWVQTDRNNEKAIAKAEEKIKHLLKSKKAYVFKLFPLISYLDIGLSERRKRYFLILNIFSWIILFTGIYLLQ